MCPGFKSLHRHHPLLKKFRREIGATPLNCGGRVLLAVSGGGDSVGMTALFLSALPRPAFEIGVAHVHHNLRGAEADRDERAAHDLARGLGLPFLSARLTAARPRGTSLEEWAREARYAALEEMRSEGGWEWVATAHHLEDQAETVLMRIARGTGLSGLAGIQSLMGRVVRPVLGFSREELREAARLCGLPFEEDSTNADRRRLRNRVRLDVLPVLEENLPGFTRRLAALARRAAEAPSPPETPEIGIFEGDTVYYPLEALRNLGEGEALEALRRGLKAARGSLRRIGERHLKALWALRSARPGASAALPEGWEGVRERSCVRLRRGPGGARRRSHEARAGDSVHGKADRTEG